MEGDPDVEAQHHLIPRMILVVAGIALLDMISQLVLTFQDWTGNSPLQQLAGLQTAGTQATVAVLTLTLLGVGLRVMTWPRQRQLLVVGGLVLAGLLAGWLAAGIPDLAGRLLADVSFTDPARLARGSRQAMAGWLTFAGWSLGLAWLLARQARAADPVS